MKPLAALSLLSSFTLALARVVATTSRAVNSGLTVELSNIHGSSVESIDDLVLVSKVTNSGQEPVRVIKYGGLLDGGFLQSFIVRKDGKDVPFTGVLAQFAVSHADEKLYRTIAPGETVTTEHNVGALYDFQSAGTGEFTFEPLLDLGPNEADDEESGLRTSNALPTASVTIAQDVSTRHPESHLDTRATPQCATNATQLALIQAAYQDNKILAATAASFISVHSASALYTRYFKENAPATITARYRAVADEKVAARLLSCTDPAFQCPGDVIMAYTWTQTFDVHLCPIFYAQVPSHRLCSGYNVHQNKIAGVTVLHEMMHMTSMIGQPSTSWIIDITRQGCAASQGLSSAEQAVNADNYACLAAEVYVNNNCPIPES